MDSIMTLLKEAADSALITKDQLISVSHKLAFEWVIVCHRGSEICNRGFFFESHA